MQPAFTLTADSCRNHDTSRKLGSLFQQTWRNNGSLSPWRPNAIILPVGGWVQIKHFLVREENLLNIRWCETLQNTTFVKLWMNELLFILKCGVVHKNGHFQTKWNLVIQFCRNVSIWLLHRFWKFETGRYTIWKNIEISLRGHFYWHTLYVTNVQTSGRYIV